MLQVGFLVAAEVTARMDWNALRNELPVTKRWAYFDHAAVAPITVRAQQALAEWADDVAHNGEVHEPRWLLRVEEVRRLAAQLLHCDAPDVAFVKNTSEGIGAVAEGFPWKSGDNVVISADEYPANVYPWMNLKGRGVSLRTVASDDGRVELDELRDAIDARTRVVSLSFVEYATGFRNDLADVGALCRERGCYFFVDAIQGLGVLPLDVRQTPIDFLSADGHKWLLGPEGCGVFYVRRELVDLLHPVGVGWNSVVGARDFSRIDFTLKPNAGRWESGSLNVGGITALGASMDLLLRAGIANVCARVLELTDYLCYRAKRAGFQVYSSRQQEEKSGIVSLVVPNADPRQLVKLCLAQNVVINSRAGRVRVSPHCYNTLGEIDKLMDLLRDGAAAAK